MRFLHSTRSVPALIGAMLWPALPLATADSVTLVSSKDNTLYDDRFGQLSNGAGQHGFVGLTPRGELRRMLVAFDLASAVPAGATITGVSLRLNLSRTNTPATIVSLQRVQADWGEGASDAPDEEGLGAPATPGDATWLHRFFDAQLWTQAGGELAAQVSAQTAVEGVGAYEWLSTPELIADVESWRADPSSNFGWCLRGNEATTSAKRFDSRENPDESLRPLLIIVYEHSCPADLDADAAVGLADLSILLSHFGMNEGALPQDGDLDADGDVDLGDLAQMLGAFGSSCR